MCREGQPDRSVTLYEGHVRCILELDSPLERLAALETVFAIAFPKDEDKPYVPPEIPTDGSRLSAEDKARRLAYNIFNGLIRHQGKRNEVRTKDQKKVGAGKRGAYVRWGDSSTVGLDDGAGDNGSSTADGKVEPHPLPTTIPTYKAPNVPKPVLEDDFSSVYEAGGYRKKRSLTEDEKREVEAWDKKIPNAEALLEFLDKNYFNSSRLIVLSKGFCEYAYQRLAKDERWISTRNNKPFRSISTVIHWLALDYQKQLMQMKKLEGEEREAEFAMKNAELSKISSTELADIERRRRRKAEKEAMEKIMRGEL